VASQTGHRASYSKVDLQGLQVGFYERLRQQGRSPNTLKNYKTDLECFNDYLIRLQKSTDITEFDLPQVKLYGDYLQNRYSSDNSRRRRVQALRRFFDFLVEQEIFSSNPVRKLPISPKFLDEPHPTSFVDIKTLWQYCLEQERAKNDLQMLTARRNQVLMLLIFGGGLKVSDIAKIKTSALLKGEKNYRVLVSHPKRDPYSIPLPEVFTPAYEKYINELERLKTRHKLSFPELFFNANPYRILSGGLSARGLEVVFEELRKKLMIQLTPKSLRQACVFKWLGQGHGDSQIKEWLGVAPSYDLRGYKNVQDRYAYNEQALKEIYDSFNKRKLSRSGF
jgi:site-specific recombinase XerD